MAWEVIIWVILFLMNSVLIGFSLHQFVLLSDLEADYMNPYEAASRINATIVPEFILHGVFCTLLLVTGHWFMFLLTVPIACYNIMLFVKRGHLIDVTEAFRVLKVEKKHRIIKFFAYSLFFITVVVREVAAGTFSTMLSTFLSKNEEIDIRSSYLEF